MVLDTNNQYCKTARVSSYYEHSGNINGYCSSNVMKSYANQIKHKIETKSIVVVTSNLLKDSGNSVETPRKVCAHGINYLKILRYCTQRCCYRIWSYCCRVRKKGVRWQWIQNSNMSPYIDV